MICNTIEMGYEHYKTILIVSPDFNATCRIFIYNDDPKTAIITDLYVIESARGSKIGTQIIDYAIDVAKGNGCCSVELKSEENNWVREWYKRLGFGIISEQVWMRKDIKQ